MLHDVKQFLVENPKIIKKYSKSSRDFNISNLMVSNARWFPYLIKSHELLLSLLIRITDNSQSANMLCVLNISTTKCSLIKIHYFEETSPQSSLLKINPFYDNLTHVILTCFGHDSAQIIFFGKKWNYFCHSVNVDTMIIDASFRYISKSELRITFFHLNFISIYKLKVKWSSKLLNVENDDLCMLSSCSSSCIVNGFDNDSSILYITRDGNIFSYDLARSVYSVTKLATVSLNEIVTCVCCVPFTTLYYVIHMHPTFNLCFKPYKSHIDLLYVGNVDNKIHSFLKSRNELVYDLKYFITGVLDQNNAQNLLKNLKLSKQRMFYLPDTPKIDKLLKWRSKYYLCCLLLQMKQEFPNIFLAIDTVDSVQSQILKHAVFYRVLLLKYLCAFDSHKDNLDLLRSTIDSITDGRQLNFSSSYVCHITHSILQKTHIGVDS
ncbi:hypothetical protein MXB_3865, partial [Myxobolus squamalis]